MLILVHGIGNKEEWQAYNVNELRKSVEKVCSLNFKNTNYEFVIKMVDWKSLLNNK